MRRSSKGYKHKRAPEVVHHSKRCDHGFIDKLCEEPGCVHYHEEYMRNGERKFYYAHEAEPQRFKCQRCGQRQPVMGVCGCEYPKPSSASDRKLRPRYTEGWKPGEDE